MKNELYRLIGLVALFSGFGAFTVGFQVSKWANVNHYVMDYASLFMAAFMFGYTFYCARQLKKFVDDYASEKSL